jgi:branched-subunit amino acid transport protein
MDRDLYIWLAIIGLGLTTLATRSGLLLWPYAVKLPKPLERALRFAPMAAMVAIVVPSVLYAKTGEIIGPLDPKLFAALACLLAWWATRHMAAVMSAGLAVYVIAKLAQTFY